MYALLGVDLDLDIFVVSVVIRPYFDNNTFCNNSTSSFENELVCNNTPAECLLPSSINQIAKAKGVR